MQIDHIRHVLVYRNKKSFWNWKSRSNSKLIKSCSNLKKECHNYEFAERKSLTPKIILGIPELALACVKKERNTYHPHIQTWLLPPHLWLLTTAPKNIALQLSLGTSYLKQNQYSQNGSSYNWWSNHFIFLYYQTKLRKTHFNIYV